MVIDPSVTCCARVSTSNVEAKATLEARHHVDRVPLVVRPGAAMLAAESDGLPGVSPADALDGLR